jgi:hypothetical protein
MKRPPRAAVEQRGPALAALFEALGNPMHRGGSDISDRFTPCSRRPYHHAFAHNPRMYMVCRRRSELALSVLSVDVSAR